MSTQVSPQIRIVAIAGLLLAVVGGSAMLLLGRSHAPAALVPTVPRVTTSATTPAAPVAKTPTTHATTTPARHATKPAAQSHARAHARAHAKPAAKPAATRRGNLVDARLPAPLQWELSQHRVVVVSLYNPRSDVDAISVAEAQAGATDADAGFLLVSVLDNAVAGPLTALLPGGGLLPNPGVLIYHAPGRVVYRFDGFADRETIAQAAANAKAGLSDASVSDPALAAASQTTTTP